jgi:RNA polymerase sigma-70 factor (ECF subfamily)
MTATRTPRMELPDEALLAAFQRGDDAAFGALYDRYNVRITSYAYRLLRRQEEAEEICTETFVRVVERKASTGSVRAWLFTIAHRLCLDRLRRHQRRQRLLEWFGWSVAERPSPEEVASLDQRVTRLESALGGLGEEHRAIVWLTYTEGLSSPEIAPIVGLTEQQVRSRLTYARRLLKAALEESDGR